MLILSCASKLQFLEGVLRRSLPQTLPIYGAVMHINRGNPVQHEVVVDSWPEFKTVLTRPRKGVIKNKLDFYANLHAAFYSDMDSCQALLENEDSIDWGRAFQMQVFQDGVNEIIQDIAKTRGVHLKTYNYVTLTHPNPSTLSEGRFKSDLLHFGTLKPSHASSLNDVWDFGGNDRSLCYLESLIRNFPSACLLDKEGQLAAWCLIDPYGCLTHGYTFPQYRGQGWIGLILQNLGRQMHALGFPLYAAVLAENEPSIRSLLNQGFHILPGTYYTLISTPVPNPKH
ncbi:glycine N-acyltransferase-like protein 3 [Anolis carolinensis]|uniref:glycine N-acyltransferase-like protein 3 n=1 Tax=Anolis carolinensis TaxID=28377 RepID=UPI0002C89F31|nr:PREDICTED: glycine N-acyltransferase-like protein 3 [Anolis carolinensis]XP_008109603.1 PREDICTED: glycine N-acyltransferase-like protein 3 [Anolis carolinensis]|eukprot:XP_008109597.1 PREDICTED: glycine N-acyltransferase-like protein 3 [Anolis carolinensis]